MPFLNLETAVNALGRASNERGVTNAKKTLLDTARTSLLAATVSTVATAAAPTATPSESGGTLAAATYKYKISAVNGNGVGIASAASADAVVSGSTGSVALTWTAVPGATSYRVFGRTGGAFDLIAEVSVTNYTDTGAITPDVTKPAPASDGTQLAAAKLALAKTALQHTIFAIECAENNMSGSGLKTTEFVKFNEPHHSAKALEAALASLSA